MDPDEWQAFEKRQAETRSLIWRRKREAQSVQIVILGQDAFYRVQKWRNGPIADAERDEWIANLSSVYVCDTRSVGRDCPEGRNPVKAIESPNE